MPIGPIGSLVKWGNLIRFRMTSTPRRSGLVSFEKRVTDHNPYAFPPVSHILLGFAPDIPAWYTTTLNSCATFLETKHHSSFKKGKQNEQTMPWTSLLCPLPFRFPFHRGPLRSGDLLPAVRRRGARLPSRGASGLGAPGWRSSEAVWKIEDLTCSLWPLYIVEGGRQTENKLVLTCFDQISWWIRPFFTQ